MSSKLFVLSIALAATTALSCSRKEAGSAALSGTQTYVKPMYSIGLSYDPAQMNDTASLAVSNLIYDGLLSFSPNLELRPALAESWTMSQDGRTLSFRLRANARFHDGTSVRASDVVKSFKRLVSPQSKVFIYYDCIRGAKEYHAGKTQTVSGLRAIGDSEVRIELRESFPPFLSVLAGATAKVLPGDAVDRPNFFRAPIGSGPFRFVSLNRSPVPELKLSAFDGYYAGKPRIEQMILRELGEEQAMREAQAGHVHDLFNYPLSGDEAVFKSGKRLQSPVAATWIIGINTTQPPFSSPQIRQAFRAAFDSEKFRRRFGPDAIPAQGYIPPGLPGFRWNYGSQKSASVSLVSPPQAQVEIMIPVELARHREMATEIEEQYRSKGWKVKVTSIPWSEMIKGYSAKSFQAFLLSMNMDYPDTEFLVRHFESSNVDNFSGIRDSGLDVLIRRARATPDRLERQKIYIELVRALNDAAVTINLFHPRGNYWTHPCVDGVEPNLLADYYFDYRTIELRADCNEEGSS